MTFVTPPSILKPSFLPQMGLVVQVGQADVSSCHTDFLAWSIIDSSGVVYDQGTTEVRNGTEPRVVVLGAMGTLPDNSATVPYYELIVRGRNSVGQWWNAATSNETGRLRFCINDNWGPVEPLYPVNEVVFTDNVQLWFESVPWSPEKGEFFCSGNDFIAEASDGTTTKANPPIVTVLPGTLMSWNVSLYARTVTGPVSQNSHFMNCRGLTFTVPRFEEQDGSTLELTWKEMRSYTVDWSDMEWNIEACGQIIDEHAHADWVLRYTKHSTVEEHFVVATERFATISIDDSTWIFSLVMRYNSSIVIASYSWSITFTGLLTLFCMQRHHKNRVSHWL